MTDAPATITPYDPKQLGEQLRDKIRIEIADLMPPEIWKDLLQSEIEKFVAPHEEHNQYNNRVTTAPSALSGIVQAELRALAKTQVQEVLSSKEWNGSWVGNQKKVGDAITALIKDNAGEILSNVLQSAIQQAVQNMHYNLNT